MKEREDRAGAITRRSFLKGVTVGGLGVALNACTPSRTPKGVPTQPFGATGHRSTRIIFGAFALAHATESAADEALDTLLEYGINHIDTAPSYGDSELHVGRWMPQYRNRFFLATKVDERSEEAAWEQIQRSLERLQVDHVDLLQLHNLVEIDEWERAMASDGALQALLRAREEGLTRFLGITGHGLAAPEMHQRSLERYAFDSVLLPLDFPMMEQKAYAESFHSLASVCEKRNVAMQTIKAIARRRWRGVKTANTWYEPLVEQEAIDLAVHWVLDEPRVFLNSAGEVRLLPSVLDAAARFRSGPSEHAMHHMVAEYQVEPLWT